MLRQRKTRNGTCLTKNIPVASTPGEWPSPPSSARPNERKQLLQAHTQICNQEHTKSRVHALIEHLGWVKSKLNNRHTEQLLDRRARAACRSDMCKTRSSVGTAALPVTTTRGRVGFELWRAVKCWLERLNIVARETDNSAAADTRYSAEAVIAACGASSREYGTVHYVFYSLCTCTVHVQ